MSHEGDNLSRMANQIGSFFASMPDRDEALEGIAMHIKRFWEPGMRHRLLAKVEPDAPASDLDPIVVDALQRHRSAVL